MHLVVCQIMPYLFYSCVADYVIPEQAMVAAFDKSMFCFRITKCS